MSLKAFHIVFIALSMLLSVFMTGWSFVRYLESPQNTFALMLIFSALMFLAIMAYLFKFKNVTGKMIWPLFTAPVFFSSPAAHACAVCFSPENETVRSSINSAILFLLAITALVLIALTYLVIRTLRQADRDILQK